jgi:hypothetical protein
MDTLISKPQSAYIKSQRGDGIGYKCQKTHRLSWARCPLRLILGTESFAEASLGAFVKYVITSQAIFHITFLAIPPRILQIIDKLERSLGEHRRSVGPKRRGLGILDLDKLCRDLRL